MLRTRSSLSVATSHYSYCNLLSGRAQYSLNIGPDPDELFALFGHVVSGWPDASRVLAAAAFLACTHKQMGTPALLPTLPFTRYNNCRSHDGFRTRLLCSSSLVYPVPLGPRYMCWRSAGRHSGAYPRLVAARCGALERYLKRRGVAGFGKVNNRPSGLALPASCRLGKTFAPFRWCGGLLLRSRDEVCRSTTMCGRRPALLACGQRSRTGNPFVSEVRLA